MTERGSEPLKADDVDLSCLDYRELGRLHGKTATELDRRNRPYRWGGYLMRVWVVTVGAVVVAVCASEREAELWCNEDSDWSDPGDTGPYAIWEMTVAPDRHTLASDGEGI